MPESGPSSVAPRPRRRKVTPKERSRRKRELRDFWLMLLLLALSGNPVFASPEPNRILVPILAVILGARVLARRKRSKKYRMVPVMAFFAFLVAVQAVHFMSLPLFTLVGLFCRLAVAYELVVLISNFAGTYIRAMLALAILSMVFFFTNLAGAAVGLDIAGATQRFALPAATNTGSWTILVHSFSEDPLDATRNAGMFWEPGAFAGYLCLALVFLCLLRQRFSKRAFYMRFAILSGCLLTTQSTMGYVAFALIILLAGLSARQVKLRAKAGPIVAAASVLVAFAVLFANQSFMLPKIEQSVLQSTTQYGSWQADRLGSLIFDFNYISARPLTGWGISDDTRLALDPDLGGAALTGRGNGMSDFAAKFGIPALLLWIYCFYRVLLARVPGRAILAVTGTLVILIMLNDECFLNYPLFLSFFFLANLRGARSFRPLRQPAALQTCPD